MEILSYAIVSIIVTGLVQRIKASSIKNPLYILAVVSIVASAIYTWLSETIYWESIVANFGIIISVANTIYTFLSPLLGSQAEVNPKLPAKAYEQ